MHGGGKGPNGRDRGSAILPGDTRRPVSLSYPHRLFPRESLRRSGGRAWDGGVGQEGVWGQHRPRAINRLLGADPKQRALG